MAKNLKLKIKNTQIASALKIKKTKLKTAGKKNKPTIKRKTKVLAPLEEKKDIVTKKFKAKILPPLEEKKEPLLKKNKIVKEKKKPLPKKTKIPAPLEEKKESLSKKTKEKKESLQEEKKFEIKKPFSTKDFKEKKFFQTKTFDSRDRLGLRTQEEVWKRRKPFKRKKIKKEIIAEVPKHLNIKLPILIKDLAAAMKLKASELISKLFSQKIIITINDFLDDETTVQFLGSEFQCDITIDRTEENRIQITKETIKEEIKETKKEDLKPRNPIVTFMGHVDHGKTSLIDCIRQTNVAAAEIGAITQHIGAFTAKTKHGNITILDTPGHEAFTHMRIRGATVTDIVILVIAGDEGIKEQTIEAINQAKKANVPIIVAINKSDKQGYNPEKIYRQLSEYDLLPEAWGGNIITINCSAVTKENIDLLLEMISLQAEMLELQANPNFRARGIILESEMHKGFGAVATILIQNGTLHINDSFVFENYFGKVKTMHDQNGNIVLKATPSNAVKITGLSHLSEAGSEFIVVKDEKEAKLIAKNRQQENWHKKISEMKRSSLDTLLKQQKKKILPIILRADMQGSLEALINAIKKIESQKVELNIISAEIGEISESDIHLAYASNAPILGFHVKIEPHADSSIKKLKVNIHTYDLIYDAVDATKELMKNTLDKIIEEKESGKATIKTVFTSSQIGKIAGCIVISGVIKRGQNAKLIREGKIIWKGKINSLKRAKDDVKEVQKGVECGVLLENFSNIQENDIIESYDINYLIQEL